MNRLALAASVLLPGLLAAGGVRAQAPGGAAVPSLAAPTFAAPGDYSFAPVSQAAPAGEASLSFGSRNTRGASIAMESGLLGDAGLRGFASLGAASGDAFGTAPGGSRVRVTTGAGEIGLQKDFGDGTVISLAGGWGRSSVPAARPGAGVLGTGLVGAGRYGAGVLP